MVNKQPMKEGNDIANHLTGILSDIMGVEENQILGNHKEVRRLLLKSITELSKVIKSINTQSLHKEDIANGRDEVYYKWVKASDELPEDKRNVYGTPQLIVLRKHYPKGYLQYKTMTPNQIQDFFKGVVLRDEWEWLKPGEKVCNCPECGAEIMNGLSQSTIELINNSRLFNKEDKLQKAKK